MRPLHIPPVLPPVHPVHNVVPRPDVHGALSLLLLPNHQNVVVLRQLRLADLEGGSYKLVNG